MRIPSSLLSLAVAASVLAALTPACSALERETTDRFKDHETNRWTSASDCEAELSSRTQAARAPRIGTWNVRFFPDSQESAEPSDSEGTDVEWLACAIALLDVDVLAIQEFKNTAAGLQKQEQLIDGLNVRTGGNWQIRLSTCPPDDVQHPGFLYDANRVSAEGFREIAILNPNPECNNDASPGFAGYFSIDGGPDFHMISVHMSSGDGASALEGRAQSIRAMEQVTRDAQALIADSDVVFAGDFNTSGCEDCDPAVGSQDEIASVAEQLSQQTPPSFLLGATQSCSRLDDGNSKLMDHFAVTQSMQEIPPGSLAEVGGICAALACSRLTAWYEDAHERLSDHCPTTLELAPIDRD